MNFEVLLVAALKRQGFGALDAEEIADWYLCTSETPFPANFQRAVLAANGYDPSQPRNADGEWTAGGGARPREHRDKGFQDRYGNGNPDTLVANPQMNIERGKAVFTRLARKQTGFEPHAMYRKGLGWIGVEAGTAGNPRPYDGPNEKLKGQTYLGGSGIAHILAKHPGAEKIIADVIQYGEVYHHASEDSAHPNFRKVSIVKGNHVVILSKFRTGRLLITGFDPGEKIDSKTGEPYIDEKERQSYIASIRSQRPFGDRGKKK